MEPWIWGLALKGPLMVALAPLYYFTVVVGVRWARRRFIHVRWVEFLTRERGEFDPEVIARREAARRRFEAEQRAPARLTSRGTR